MSALQTKRSETITDLLNATLLSVKTVVPIDCQIMKPRLLQDKLTLHYGVFIGMTGDIQGKLILTGDPKTFGLIGQSMFGMPLEGEMLLSFSGELGNMIAGGLSTNIVKNGIDMNITAPTMMQGDTKLAGYKQALEVPVEFENIGQLNVFLLID